MISLQWFVKFEGPSPQLWFGDLFENTKHVFFFSFLTQKCYTLQWGYIWDA